MGKKYYRVSVAYDCGTLEWTKKGWLFIKTGEKQADVIIEACMDKMEAKKKGIEQALMTLKYGFLQNPRIMGIKREYFGY